MCRKTMQAPSPKTPASAPSVPAIEMALEAGAAVMVTSHLGRPTEGEFKPEDSLAPVAKRLGELLGREVPVVANWVDGVSVAPGQLVLLENCRVNKGREEVQRRIEQEDGRAVRHLRARRLWHRPPRRGHHLRHRPVRPIACAGPLLAAEIDAISKALANPKRPLAAIVAGSKVPPSSPFCKAWPRMWTSSSSAAALPTPSCWLPA